MKILLDGRLLSERPTGISRYSVEMIKMYQRKFGYNNVYVLINNLSKQKMREFNWIETRYKPFSIIDFFLIYFLLKKLDFSVFHSLFYSNSFFKVKKMKYILTVHDLMYEIVEDFFGNNKIKNFFGRKYYNFIVGRSLKNSDHVISISNTTKNDIKKIFLKNSVFIPQGLNKINNRRKKVSILENEKYFLYVGNSRPHKNLEFLISTYEESDVSCKLVLVGSNNNFFVKKPGILNLGFVEDEELNWLYENCIAFIFPSKYEGFGMPILEALNKGAKVLSSTGGALKEFSKNSIFYFDPYDKTELLNLLDNVENMEKNREDIELELKKYDWRNTEKILINYLNKWLY